MQREFIMDAQQGGKLREEGSEKIGRAARRRREGAGWEGRGTVSCILMLSPLTCYPANTHKHSELA